MIDPIEFAVMDDKVVDWLIGARDDRREADDFRRARRHAPAEMGRACRDAGSAHAHERRSCRTEVRPGRGLISPDMAGICARYATAHRQHNFQGGDPQAPKSHSVWGDFLIGIPARIAAAEGRGRRRRAPSTYSFYRVYVPGEELLAHKDRAACEVSCTRLPRLRLPGQGLSVAHPHGLPARRPAAPAMRSSISAARSNTRGRRCSCRPAAGMPRPFCTTSRAMAPTRDQRFDGRQACSSRA